MSKQQPQRSGKSATAKVQTQSNCNPTRRSLHDLVRNTCDDVGIGPLPDLPLIGQVRCPGISKGAKNRACWINIKIDYVHIVDHSSGFTSTVTTKTELTAKHHQTLLRKRAQAQRLLRSKQVAATLEVRRVWQSAQPCVDSEYTKRKRIKAYGCRWYVGQRCLLVPLRNVDGELISLQRIYDGGEKRYWAGVPTRGLFFQIGEIQSGCSVLVTEGIATGSTLFELTGKPVICAMTAGNLLVVGELLRYKHPDVEITICGDDDRGTPGNPGQTKATEAAIAIGAKLAMPSLCEDCKCSDFNDQANCDRGAS